MAKKKAEVTAPEQEAEKTETAAPETGEEKAEAAVPKIEKTGDGEKSNETFSEKTIYIGPTIAKLGLAESTIYQAGAAYPTEAAEKIPAVKKLFVPIRKFTPALPDNMRLWYNRALERAKTI